MVQAASESEQDDDTNLKHIGQQVRLLTEQQVSLNHKLVQLDDDKNHFNQTPPTTYQAVQQLNEQIKMRSDMTEILVDDLSQSLSNTQQRANKLIEFQKNVQVQLLSEQVQEVRVVSMSKLHDAAELITLNQKEMTLLSDNLALAKKLNDVYQQYESACSILMESMNKAQAIEALRKQMAMEQQVMDDWLEKMNVLNHTTQTQLNGTENDLSADQIMDEAYLFYYTQQVHLSSIRMTLLEATINEKKITENLNSLTINNTNNTSTDTLKNALDNEKNTLNEAMSALHHYQQLMNKQTLLLDNALKNRWLNVTKASKLKSHLNILKISALSLEKALKEKQTVMQTAQVTLQTYMTQMVAKRQAILKTDDQLALSFFSQLAELPRSLMRYFLGLWEQVWHGIIFVSMGIRVLMGAMLGVTACIWWIGRKYFYILSHKMVKNRQRTASNIVYILSELFRRNWGSLCLFALGWFILRMAGMNFNAYVGLFYTVIIWFCFRVIMGIARILLVERGSDTQGHDVTLYHRLKWVFIIGGWVTVLMVLSKQFDMGGVVFEISTRLFMAFLLTLSMVLIRARNLVPSLLAPLIAHRKYLSRTVQTVCWVLPLGLFVSTALGLLGYINLSWLLIYYQAMLVLVIASYIIIRGIVIDLLDISSDWVIFRLKQGWLWNEAFLKPLDKLLRLFLFFGMIVSVFLVLGWHHDSPVVTQIRIFFNYSFFYFSGIDVTLFNVIKFIALVSFFFWLSKWTREFAYRWVFRNAKDVGIRNSLAVFCQYAMITLGSTITLRTLGIDFTGLSMVLGGLAVGLGFGLRDFASNIVGGLMLLIERSVKEGDVVSIGTYEGEVMHIGIRAMRIRSWDHMEIMVPNSEILMRTFINWTHQNSVVRTVIPIKIHRVDDPIVVQQLILNLLKTVPEILPEPHSEVFFTNMNDALIEFEVRYFINISACNRPEVRSKVLLMLLNAFKDADIRPPYMQQDFYMWTPEEEAKKNKNNVIGAYIQDGKT